MSTTTTSLLVFASIFGCTMLTMGLRFLLPKHHLNADTKDTVKLAMGLVATMAALVLGLLVASAKGAYDAEKSEVTLMSSKIAFLDRILAAYGPEAAPVREGLRQGVEGMLEMLWPERKSRPAQLDPSASSGMPLYNALQKLSPRTDEERALKAQALSSAFDIGQMRWLLFEQSGSAISMPLLVVLVCWLTLIFCSFGLFAPANGTVIVALMVAAFSVSGAIFLILELDRPFDGVIQISSGPVRAALAHLGQ